MGWWLQHQRQRPWKRHWRTGLLPLTTLHSRPTRPRATGRRGSTRPQQRRCRRRMPAVSPLPSRHHLLAHHCRRRRRPWPHPLRRRYPEGTTKRQHPRRPVRRHLVPRRYRRGSWKATPARKHPMRRPAQPQARHSRPRRQALAHCSCHRQHRGLQGLHARACRCCRCGPHRPGSPDACAPALETGAACGSAGGRGPRALVAPWRGRLPPHHCRRRRAHCSGPAKRRPGGHATATASGCVTCAVVTTAGAPALGAARTVVA